MWAEHVYQTADAVRHYYYTLGEGEPLVWINGGPGESHHGLRVVARGMASRFRCVLYDQRGCGNTRLTEFNAETLHIDRFIADLEGLREALAVERLCLVGHSWGAMLALAYSIAHPERVAAQALIGMGPATPQLAAVTKNNIRARLDRHKRYLFDVLRSQRKLAIADRDYALQAKLHQRLMDEFYATAWVYTLDRAKRFAAEFRTNYEYNPYIAEYAMPSWYALDALTLAEGLAVPTLAMYGYQDPAPIIQAGLLAERMPYVRACLLDECGHMPWLDQPEAFYAEIDRFFPEAD